MKTRDEIMREIIWESKKRSGKLGRDDITIRVSSKSEKKINIYFKNGTKEHFKDGVIFGLLRNRMIFEQDGKRGYAVSTTSTSASDYGFISVTLSNDAYKDWTGDYQLKHDDFYDFWYIEKESNEDEQR